MKISFFQGIVLGVFALGAIIGLVVFATYSGGTSKTAIGSVTIWGTLPATQIQSALTTIVQSNQSLKNVTYVAKDPASFDQALVSAIAAGQGPDLILTSQEDLVTLASVIQPIAPSSLSAATFASDFTQGSAIWEAPGNAGSYGVPFLIDPLILYANQAILASSGIAQVPSTWEALTGLVPKVAQTGNNASLSRELIPLGTYGNITDARAIISALFLQAGASLATRQSSGIIAADLGQQSANGEPPGQAVLRFFTQFADPTKVSYTWNASLPQSQQAFAEGDSALYLGYASEASYFAAANPNLSFSTTPLPQPASAATKLTYGRIYAFSIPRGSANAAGALAAASALVSASADQAAANATGLAPALRPLLAAAPSAPLAATTYASALYATGWLSPAPSATDQVFSAMIGSVNSGQLSLPAALANAQSALNSLFQ